MSIKVDEIRIFLIDIGFKKDLHYKFFSIFLMKHLSKKYDF